MGAETIAPRGSCTQNHHGPWGSIFPPATWSFCSGNSLAALGVSTWNTGSQVLIADVTELENRGRAVAVRSMSVRLGNIAGPFIGALLTTAFSIRSIFLFNVVTKLVVIVITLFLIKETRPESAKPKTGETRRPVEKLGASHIFDQRFSSHFFCHLCLGHDDSRGVFRFVPSIRSGSY